MVLAFLLVIFCIQVFVVDSVLVDCEPTRNGATISWPKPGRGRGKVDFDNNDQYITIVKNDQFLRYRFVGATEWELNNDPTDPYNCEKMAAKISEGLSDKSTTVIQINTEFAKGIPLTLKKAKQKAKTKPKSDTISEPSRIKTSSTEKTPITKPKPEPEIIPHSTQRVKSVQLTPGGHSVQFQFMTTDGHIPPITKQIGETINIGGTIYTLARILSSGNLVWEYPGAGEFVNQDSISDLQREINTQLSFKGSITIGSTVISHHKMPITKGRVRAKANDFRLHEAAEWGAGIQVISKENPTMVYDSASPPHSIFQAIDHLPHGLSNCFWNAHDVFDTRIYQHVSELKYRKTLDGVWYINVQIVLNKDGSFKKLLDESHLQQFDESTKTALKAIGRRPDPVVIKGRGRGFCLESSAECDIDYDRAPFVIPKHVLEIDYEFYGTKSSAEGGVERSEHQIECNGVPIFKTKFSTTKKVTEPWTWHWMLLSDPEQVYVHIDGLIFMNLKEEYYVQLVPKTTKKTTLKLSTKLSPIKNGGCVMEKYISYIGRWWAFENGDLVNYNIYMWTLTHTPIIDSEHTRSDTAIFCNSNDVQKHNYCQLFAQNNVLQYEVDTDESYTELQSELMADTTVADVRRHGFEGGILSRGFQRFGAKSACTGKTASDEDSLREITPEWMEHHQCIGIMVRYTIPPRSAHFIVYKYLKGQGWFALDANVNNPHGPYKTLLEAERDANQFQKTQFGFKIASAMIYYAYKDVDYFKAISITSSAASAATAKQEVYDDVMNYEKEYDTYGIPYRPYRTDHSVENTLLDYSFEIIILLSFLCYGLCFSAIVGFICICLGMCVSYIFIKYKQNAKTEYEIVNSENEEEV